MEKELEGQSPLIELVFHDFVKDDIVIIGH